MDSQHSQYNNQTNGQTLNQTNNQPLSQHTTSNTNSSTASKNGSPTEVKSFNKLQMKNQSWKLKEFVQVGPENFEGSGEVPLQLLHFGAPTNDRNEASGKSIWFLAGFRGANRNDGHILNLVQRAISNQTFENRIDVFVTPLVNPSSKTREPCTNHQGIDLTKAFTDQAAGGQCVEVRTMKRWVSQINPKCIVTVSNGQQMIRYLNTPLEVVQKLSEISEIPNYVFGTEPEEVLEDGTKVARENFEQSFGSFCVANGITWIDFSVDKSKKNFEDLKNLDWKPSIGPALKWIVEGYRFDPPKEEPKPVLPEVIPVLDFTLDLVNL